ncbi:MAG: RsmB/NOP family class I SAM-dependent RNA methyltransferase [Clostridiales bacterium]|jgi:NOL1/NOP2/sun family putative RNA methylase|nr:RsmB/NOP family class I SAM-dependent RNA methyltransferase [Clostridiales bacterium]
MNLPPLFVENMREILADERQLAQFLAALGGRREYGLRVNTLKISLSDFAELFALPLEPIPWCPNGFYYEHQKELPLGKNPLYYAGLYYIQEPSAMSAAALLDAQPGDKVLDLCASPGGKSTQIAAALGGEGLLVANDANFGRIPQLLRNIEMAGIKNSIVLCEMPKRLAERFEGYFDRVLVDAPCSGEGMFRKDSASIAAWDAGKSRRLAAIQKNILAEAAKMTAPGGYLVYSTCTFSRLENEEVVADFLAKNRDFEAVGEIMRIWPHIHRGEGHFAAKFRRKNAAPLPAPLKSAESRFLGNKDFREFCDKYRVNLPKGRIFAHSDRIFIAPPIYPHLAGLRTIRAGLLLGTPKKQRFEPSYALAMALKKADFAQIIDLAPEDPRIQKFLKGDSFPINAEAGYNLICAAAHPLGFAKIQKNRLKGRIK